jgi:hypothetical protein
LEPKVEGKSAKAIQAFNELVAADETVEKVMLTVRDGFILHPEKSKIRVLMRIKDGMDRIVGDGGQGRRRRSVRMG